MTNDQIIAGIERVCRRGGEVTVGAAYPGEPHRGVEVRVRLATPWKGGPEEHLGSGSTAAEALAAALDRVQRS